MKKLISTIGMAGLMVLPLAATAEVEFGGDAEWNAFSRDTGADDAYQGYQQRIRVNANFKNDDGVQVITRWNLTDRYWAGDDGSSAVFPALGNGMTGTTGAYSSRDNVGPSFMDIGYVQMPVAGWTVRVGRQEANWGNCFYTCDARRDRISALRRFGGTTVGVVMDHRNEGDLSSDDDDGFSYAALAVGVANGWLWGVVGGYYSGYGDDTTFLFHQAKAFSAFTQGKIGGVGVNAVVGYLGGISDDTAAPLNVFNGTHWTMLVKADYDFGGVKLEGQWATVQNGGLVAGGWDSFSSMISNSPEHNVNPLSQWGFGELAVQDVTDEVNKHLVAARISGQVTDNVKLVGALGGVQMEDNAGDNFTDTFVEFQAHYQVAPSTRLELVLASLSGDKTETTVVEGDTATAVGLNLHTSF